LLLEVSAEFARQGKVKKDSRIVLIGTLSLDVVLIIHVLNVLLGVVLGLLAVDEVHALGLGQLVNLSTGNTDKELLGELMGDRLACGASELVVQSCEWRHEKRTILALSVLEDLEGTE
jgi:hypothetical protein